MAIKRKIQVRRGAAADRPTLSSGEFGLDTDTGSEALYIGTPAGNMQLAMTADSNISHLPFAFQSGLGANVTRYIIPAYYNVESDDGDMRYYMSGSGTVESFTVTGRSGTSPAQEYTDTYTLRKNGVDTSMTVTITKPAGSIAQQLGTSTADPVSFVANDWIDIKAVTTGTTFINLAGHIKIKLSA